MKVESKPGVVLTLSHEEAVELREFLSKTSEIESSIGDEIDALLECVGIKLK